jgi:hypothetical protein
MPAISRDELAHATLWWRRDLGGLVSETRTFDRRAGTPCYSHTQLTSLPEAGGQVGHGGPEQLQAVPHAHGDSVRSL